MDCEVRDTYFTFNGISEGLYKEKGSKFLSFALPISSADEAKAILEEKRRTYHDARHVCYAFVCGYDAELMRSSDDGEPSGTAGRPILSVLQANKLTNAMIVVVRYFGGTKLGTSGLINAYAESSADAVANNKVVEKTIEQQLSVFFEYQAMNDIMRIVKEMEPTIVEQSFDLQCHLLLSIRKRDVETLRSKIEKLKINPQCGNIKIE